MRSLRTRLFVYLVGAAAALLVPAGLALSWRIAGWLQGEFDRGLEGKARALIALTEQDGGQVEFDFEPELMPEFADAPELEYFELWLGDGSLFRRSPSFDRTDARRARLVRTGEPAPVPRFQDVLLPDGRRGRQVRVEFVPRIDAADDPEEARSAPVAPAAPADAPPATLIVARERQRLDADLGRLRLAIGGVTAGFVLALAAVIHLALRVGFRSLDELGRQVQALDVTSLGRRVVVGSPPDEIAVVVRQVNALLERLEAGFARERRLSSDIAHELNTPIAELRSLCEVGGRWPGDRTATRRFFEDAQAIALQMEQIVVHLMALARYDEGRERAVRGAVRVAEVVEAAWRRLARLAEARRIEFRPQVAPALCLETDPDKFALIVANVLANAVEYSPAGGVVTCASAESDGRASLSVSNRAEGLEPGDLAVMFDRFWRKDTARTDGRHAGLGLSLVRAFADLLGLEVGVRLDADRTFCLTLSGPARR